MFDTRTPPERAAAIGHIPVIDPPSGMSAAQRWTCATCGAAVIDYLGNIYGSALDGPCPPAGSM